VGAAAELGQQGEGVAAVAEGGWVIPGAGGDGFGGQVDAGQQAGGQVGRVLAVVGVDVDQ
jgi:hypothetical protein